jgi:hypothetical protein
MTPIFGASRWCFAALCTVLSVGLVGCSGNDGSRGPQGDAGAQGSEGPTGPTGPNGDPGPIISTRAALGLDIAPVALDLTGLTGAEIEQVGQGSYIVNAAADCTGCHVGPAPTFAYLAGGGFDFPVNATFTAFVKPPNLTPDGQSGLHRSESEFIEILRTGRDFVNNGDSLRHLPWATARWMSTDDIKAVYAYLKHIPPVFNQFSRNKSGLPAYTPKAPVPFPTNAQGQPIYNEGLTDIVLPADDGKDRDNILRGLAIQHVRIDDGDFEALSPEEQKLYGRGSYIVNATHACGECHTNGGLTGRGTSNAWFDGSRDDNLKVHTEGNLAGGKVFPGLFPGVARVMSANLLGPGNGIFSSTTYTFTEFLMAMTSGTHKLPNGVRIPIAPPMPWDTIRNLETDDLLSLYVYLTHAPRSDVDPITQQMAFSCTDDTPCTPLGGTCDATNHECSAMPCISDAQCPACQSCGTGSPIPSGVCGFDPAVYPACAVFGL